MSAVLAPLVNSYKRLVPGYEAPVYVSWARVNRSALIRVPKITAGKPQAPASSCAAPTRRATPTWPSPSCCAPAWTASSTTCPCPPPVEENLYHFDESELARRNMPPCPARWPRRSTSWSATSWCATRSGEHVYERFIEAKRQEWDDFRMRVTPWEVERYLEIFYAAARTPSGQRTSPR